MILPLLLSLLGPLQAEPPVRISLNHEQFTRGAPPRADSQAAQDRHLVALPPGPQGRRRSPLPV